jgi:hypothetical protein
MPLAAPTLLLTQADVKVAAPGCCAAAAAGGLDSFGKRMSILLKISF